MSGVTDNFDQEYEKFHHNVKAALQGLAPVVANTAVNHFRHSFTAQAWGLIPWKNRKKRDKGRAILVKKGRLKRSIRDIGSSGYKVQVGSDVPYAKAHNEGFKGTVGVKKHNRKKSRKMKVSSTSLKTRNTTSRRTKVNTGISEVREHSRNMNIPKRQFMGNSVQLHKNINHAIINHLIIFLK
jgi:phage gpG-like protein